jgi:hypothetical protein
VKPPCAVYWSLENTLFNKKPLNDYIKMIIHYYNMSGAGSQNLLTAWNEMKQEV